MSEGKETAPVAIFAVHLTSMRPKITWANLSLATPGFLSEIVAAGVMKLAGEKLQFRVPLSKPVVLSLGDAPAKDRPKTKIRKEKMPIKSTGGLVEFDVAHDNIDLSLLLNFSTPLFSPEGVWLLASDKPPTSRLSPCPTRP